VKICKLTVENIMRVSAVEITPTGNVVIIGGNNGQGKTSVLHAIEMALGGKDKSVAMPIRAGAEKARIVVDLGDLIVERVFTASGTRLIVKAKDGATYPSPQSMLDGLIGRLTFDPLAFARAEPKKKLEILKSVTGLSFVELDAKRKALYDERTVTNRLHEQAKVSASSIQISDDTPDEPLNTAELLRDLEAVREHNSGITKLQQEAEHLDGLFQQQMLEVESIKEKLLEAEGRLSVAKTRVQEAESKLIGASILDAGPISSKLQSADRINGAVAIKKRKAEWQQQAEAHRAKVDALSQEIDKIDETKQGMVANAKLPIAGLGFMDDGVTFNGIPFEQASSAEQLRASCAIGFALNPKIKVMLVRDGSLLDEHGIELLSKTADESGAQVWIERVGHGDEVSFIIEDGHLQQAQET
jgi:DNA repair exonuclease SbcCD ATPase subunit